MSTAAPEFAAVNRRALGGKRRTLVTPEGIDLKLTLGSSGQRAGAFLLDLIIMLGALIGLTIAAGLLIGALGLTGVELGEIVWMLGFFLLRNFYFILMEMGPRAATFGKRGVGLRVVARSGERLTADRVIARNMVREIEFYLPLSFMGLSLAEGGASGWIALAGLIWTGIFLFFPLFNADRLRVGDLLAGTWVVNVPPPGLATDTLARAAAASGAMRFSDAQLDIYGVYELQTLEQVLRNGDGDQIGTVAATIRAKIGSPAEGAYAFDRDFLAAYYDAARARMERGLLFGKRREDKFDRSG